MLKLSDEEYFLPEISALCEVDVFNNCTTQPMLIRGVCKKTGIKSDYVVKFKGSPRMSPIASCRELIASFIAMEFGFYIPEPVIIDISTEFIETIIGKDGYKNAINSVGINFGCKYLTGFMEFTSNQHLNYDLCKQAEQIFVFDVFISNTDRRTDKPNILTNGNEILIFDHELAFGFLLDINKNPTPWIISDSDESWIKKHAFYQTLRNNKHNFDKLIEKLTLLNDHFWNKMYKTIPDEWLGKHFDDIKNNLYSIIENRNHFKKEQIEYYHEKVSISNNQIYSRPLN